MKPFIFQSKIAVASKTKTLHDARGLIDSIADSMPEGLRQSWYHMKRCFARKDIMEELERSIEDKAERTKVVESVLGYILSSTQEAAVVPPYITFSVQPNPGFWEYVKTLEHLMFHCLVWLFSSSIGNGVSYISKFMSSKLNRDSESAKPLLDYLLALNHVGESLMINETLSTVDKLQVALIVEDVYLSSLPKDTLYQNFEKRLPTTFNIVIFSIHGYFGQADVLGLPDTGGQVVYILDQVRAMEEELLFRIKKQGLSVKPQILVVTRLIPDARGTKYN
ncbi:hypothetical protein IFM89_026652 [Coptis chinensis]|uniref:sucrose synthase n=1 Tax=Coptis chinensis TaxID=261450 RepID=A0A835LNQ2_9MAGN|nr:hypothetical protein IFM89_026652 [Coptis chinensis]